MAKQKTVPFGITPTKALAADAFIGGTVTKEHPMVTGTDDIPFVRTATSMEASFIPVDASGEPLAAEPPVAMKRLTIDVPLDLHRKLKVKAAMEGVQMADLVRSWIKERCA